MPFLIVWGVMYMLGNGSTRLTQLKASLAGAILGPISEIVYFKDYWHPAWIWPIYIGRFSLLIEDILFGFAILGITSICFEIVTQSEIIRIPEKIPYTFKFIMVALLLSGAFSSVFILGINSIYATAIAFMVASIPILMLRHDLFLNALVSGLFVMLLIFFSYSLLFYLVPNTEYLFLYAFKLGGRITGIPLTEIIFGFTFGFFLGPLDKFLRSKKAVRAKTLI